METHHDNPDILYHSTGRERKPHQTAQTVRGYSLTSTGTEGKERAGEIVPGLFASIWLFLFSDAVKDIFP